MEISYCSRIIAVHHTHCAIYLSDMNNLQRYIFHPFVFVSGSQAFREAGFTPYFIPVLHFEYTNGDQLAAALMDSVNYSGITLCTVCLPEASTPLQESLGSRQHEVETHRIVG